MSGDDVEELFGEGGGAPAPRTGAILGLLFGGLVVGLLGMACTAVPGGVMVLMSWMLVEKEHDRIDSGYLPADARTTVGRLQVLAYVGVLLVIVMFGLQAYLFCSGAYDELWRAMLVFYIESTT